MQQPQPTNYILTDASIISYQPQANDYFYLAYYAGKKLEVTICNNCNKKIIDGIKDIKHILKGLIINDKLPSLDNGTIHWEPNGQPHEYPIYLKQLLDAASYPKTPKEKKDNLLEYFNEAFQIVAREPKYLSKERFLKTPYIDSRLYFKNISELDTYFEKLVEEKYLEAMIKEGKPIAYYRVSYTGAEYLQDFKVRNNLKTCFVAMSFDDSMKPTREAIRTALVATGYEPDIIDELAISTKGTINDKMLGRIRDCKFSIADFTQRNQGVYFEAGYALGLGKEVIYTCHTDDFSAIHFDIKSNQTLKYKSVDELTKLLISQIKSLIK